MTRTTAYPDTLGNDLQIVSFVYPLYDINKSRIGMISVDMPVEYLYQKLSIQYLGKGDISLISKTGDIIRSENYGF